MEEIRFKTNSDEKEYTLDDCPNEITQVDYIVFPILEKEVIFIIISMITHKKLLEQPILVTLETGMTLISDSTHMKI